MAGYQRGFEDARGTLFFEIVKIAKKHQPKVLFLENVKNLKSHDKGKTFSIIKSSLENLGYALYADILNLQEREIITFFFLAGQGDTSVQMQGHAKGNFKMGTSKEKLISLINANIHLIGYPCSLNAINAVIA